VRNWFKPWVASATAGLLTFGAFHQVFVDLAPAVFIGLPMAWLLSVPIVAAYAGFCRRHGAPSGAVFGLVVFAGLVPHYVLITVAMWGRTFDDGPRGGWEILAVSSAPIVSGVAAWALWRSVRGTLWLVVGMVTLTVMISGFQASEPDLRNLGALVSLFPACLAAGVMLGHFAPASTAPQRSVYLSADSSP
jgi:hypothetical protein